MNALPRRLPAYIVGFTAEIPYYMSLSDFFIGKPGPGSISEAVAMKLPVIVQRNAWTLPQERYNADWVREKNVGIVVKDFSSIRDAVTDLLEPARFREFQSAVAAIDNRAVFEIVDILDGILAHQAA
jgi:UDP-N-acetylglucosamine:LPS N-acetylglucosamine transferase